MQKLLKNLVPNWFKRMWWKYQNTKAHSAYLRESTNPADIGVASPLIKTVFEQIKDIPGWFNLDDCGHFFLILSYQSAMGTRGDLLEIGSYHGRSTSLMCRCLQDGERMFVCDAFETDTDDEYQNKPSPLKLINNVTMVNPELDKNRIVVHECLSNNLDLKDSDFFRLIHIDGGHSEEQAFFDLKLCSDHLLKDGIIVMDDYHNPQWPGVTAGTDKFLAEHTEFKVIADLNRHGALGRKLYLIKTGSNK